MDLFIRSFLLGIISFLVYKTEVYKDILDVLLMVKSGVRLLKEDEIFQLAKINLTRAEENEDGFQKVFYFFIKFFFF